MARKGEIVAAVDFGSHAVRVAIACRTLDGQTRVLGYGMAHARGCVQFGAIQSSDAAIRAFQEALNKARKMANARIHNIYCGIQGKSLKTDIFEGKAKIVNGIVKPEHMEEARKNAALSSHVADSRPISSVMSEEWFVDSMRVTDPIGMHGSALKARIHFTQLSIFLENNLRACIESQGLEVVEFVFMPLGAAHGCLTCEDMQLGVAVINLGASSTGIAVYHNNAILAAFALDRGSGLIVNDVAAGLKVSFEEAMELVNEYGINMEYKEKPKASYRASDTAPPEQSKSTGAPIKLKRTVTGAPSTISKDDLDAIIYERSNEMTQRICDVLEKNKLLNRLARGIAITGGGASVINQEVLLEQKSGVPTRIGTPVGFAELPESLDTPEWTPALGIINFAYGHQNALVRGHSGRHYPNGQSFFTSIRRFIAENIF